MSDLLIHHDLSSDLRLPELEPLFERMFDLERRKKLDWLQCWRLEVEAQLFGGPLIGIPTLAVLFGGPVVLVVGFGWLVISLMSLLFL